MISIIITVLNESKLYLENTLKSLISTLEYEDEIIIIDDFSDIPVYLDNKSKRISIHRNLFRLGVANSRHVGATFAKNKWLLLTDGHMIYENQWRHNFAEYQETSTEKTIYNGTCLGLWENKFNYDNLDLNKLSHYHGARLSLYEEKENQILEGKWINEKKDEDNYEISCLMGAIYFIQKKYFFNIRGLSDLKMWGSDEPCLSLKTLLSGGEIRQLKNVKAAHIFRKSAPYSTGSQYLLYNKIRMAKTLLPDKVGENLINKLNKDGNFTAAMNLIKNEDKFIQEYKNYYKSIFTKDLYDICKEFQISDKI